VSVMDCKHRMTFSFISVKLAPLKPAQPIICLWLLPVREKLPELLELFSVERSALGKCREKLLSYLLLQRSHGTSIVQDGLSRHEVGQSPP
jgi:hypothetical protein